jgi:hypothetical protein
MSDTIPEIHSLDDPLPENYGPHRESRCVDCSCGIPVVLYMGRVYHFPALGEKGTCLEQDFRFRN